MTTPQTPKKKTWQREVSAVLLCFLMYLAWAGSTEELEILVWPFTLFSFAAYGFKQPTVESYMGNRTQKVIQNGDGR